MLILDLATYGGTWGLRPILPDFDLGRYHERENVASLDIRAFTTIRNKVFGLSYSFIQVSYGCDRFGRLAGNCSNFANWAMDSL